MTEPTEEQTTLFEHGMCIPGDKFDATDAQMLTQAIVTIVGELRRDQGRAQDLCKEHRHQGQGSCLLKGM